MKTLEMNDSLLLERFVLPESEHIFLGNEVFAAAAGDKVAGAGDSAKNLKTIVKAPGGNDAAKSRDGG